MLIEMISKFMNSKKYARHELFYDSTMGETDMYDEMAVIPYQLAKTFDVEELMNILEDDFEMTILYHLVPCCDTSFGIQVCAYSDCELGEMFKIHGSSNSEGKVVSLTVTIYSSVEVMYGDIISDLDRHENRGRFLSKRDKADLLVEFSCISA